MTNTNVATRFLFPHFFPDSRAMMAETLTDIMIIVMIIQSFILSRKADYGTDELKQPQNGSSASHLTLPAKSLVQFAQHHKRRTNHKFDCKTNCNNDKRKRYFYDKPCVFQHILNFQSHHVSHSRGLNGVQEFFCLIFKLPALHVDHPMLIFVSHGNRNIAAAAFE